MPCGKIKNNKKFSILTDHLGTPTQMYDEEGEQVWEQQLDTNGKPIYTKENGITCDIRFQGQYYDKDIELCYNRFRWYDDVDGRYISKDPIGLSSGEFGFYNYVEDPNTWVDVFGLAKTYKMSAGEFKKRGSIQGEMGNAKGVYIFKFKNSSQLIESYVGQAQGKKGFGGRTKRSWREIHKGTSRKKAKSKDAELIEVEFHEFDPTMDKNVNAQETRIMEEKGGLDNLLNERQAPST